MRNQRKTSSPRRSVASHHKTSPERFPEREWNSKGDHSLNPKKVTREELQRRGGGAAGRGSGREGGSQGRTGEKNTPPARGERHQDQLKLGDLAPDFTLPDQAGKQKVTLSSFRGKKPVVLIFASYT